MAVRVDRLCDLSLNNLRGIHLGNKWHRVSVNTKSRGRDVARAGDKRLSFPTRTAQKKPPFALNEH